MAIPGDIGVGLLVAQAVEFAMAAQIARLVGLDYSEDSVFKLLGAVPFMFGCSIWLLKYILPSLG